MITAALRAHRVGASVGVVGLFVNEQPAQINAIIERCDLDYVQLSGDETPQQAGGICRPLIKSLRLSDAPAEAAWLRLASSSRAARHPPAELPAFAPWPFVVDAHVPGSYGGTGTLSNWERAAVLARQQSFLLAGGLTPANVASAIAQVCPHGVDVSSGVESDGCKDSALIVSFIQAVRSAAQRAE